MSAIVSIQRDVFDGPCFTIWQILFFKPWEKGLHSRKGRVMPDIRDVRT